MPLFYVKIRKNIDICNYLPIYYPAICRGWGTFSVPSLGEGWGGAPYKQLFLYRQRRTFLTGNGRFLYRRGGCRHARHDGGDGGDGKEENSFSDCRHRQPRQGEADSHSHGFLYLYQPIIEVSINGFTPQSALRKQQQLCRSCVSPAQGCGRSTLPWVSIPH